jgi:hypothetical protein
LPPWFHKTTLLCSVCFTYVYEYCGLCLNSVIPIKKSVGDSLAPNSIHTPTCWMSHTPNSIELNQTQLGKLHNQHTTFATIEPPSFLSTKKCSSHELSTKIYLVWFHASRSNTIWEATLNRMKNVATESPNHCPEVCALIVNKNETKKETRS